MVELNPLQQELPGMPLLEDFPDVTDAFPVKLAFLIAGIVIMGPLIAFFNRTVAEPMRYGKAGK